MTHDYKHEVRDYNDGQIHGWNGGACPVHPKDVVEVWFRGGGSSVTVATRLFWPHSDKDGDIIAFKVVKVYVEPKVIWVNEHNSLLWVAYQSEQGARDDAVSSATRIAVKYVEAVNDKGVQE